MLPDRVSLIKEKPMPFGIPDTRQFPWDQALSNNLEQLTNPVTGGINTWTTAPTVGVDGAVLGTNHTGYTGIDTNLGMMMRWDGTTWVPLMASVKYIMTPSANFYVNAATGSDSNDGLTASTALKTTDKLYQVMRLYDFQDKEIKIHLGAGSYSVGFPSNTVNLRISVIGTSASTVNLNYMYVEGQKVLISNLTIADSLILNNNSYMIWVQSGTIHFGPNVVVGNTGVGSNIVLMKSGYLALYPVCPITVTHNFARLFYLFDSTVALTTGYQEMNGLYSNAPPVSKGVVYTSEIPPMGSQAQITVNFQGSRAVEEIFRLSKSVVAGSPDARFAVVGNVTGVPYHLTDNSLMQNATVVGLPLKSRDMGFPSTMSSGYKDSTSTVVGAVGI